MDVHTDLQNSTQSHPQLQVQTNPPPDDPSPAMVPEDTSIPRPPPASDTNIVGARAPNKLPKETATALGFEYLHLGLSLLVNTRFCSQQDIWAHT